MYLLDGYPKIISAIDSGRHDGCGFQEIVIGLLSRLRTLHYVPLSL